MTSNIQIVMSVCVDRDFGYTKDGSMPWSIDSEYENFQTLLSSYPQGQASICIGRITYENDGVPDHLKQRFAKIYVITNTKSFHENNIHSISSLGSAIEDLKEYLLLRNDSNPHHVFILGGDSLYKQVFEDNYIDKLVMSKLPTSYNCSKFLDW